MRHKRIGPSGSIYIADGYGLKIHVERGHLVVHDGVGRDRRTVRFNRATSGLRRLVVIGHTGYVTFEALRWIRDVRAAFVQIDRDGTLVAVSAPERLHESKLRRAQVLAAERSEGREAMIHLLKTKLERQAQLVERRLLHLRQQIVRNHRTPVGIGEAIREQIPKLTPDLSFGELRRVESIAGRYYWQTWALLPISFDRSWRGAVPAHWRTAGPRTSKVDLKGGRRALTPAHALLNYTYAIVETEAIIAAQTLGLDPSLGLMHTDQRYRTSLATDLMEPARPAADEIVLDILHQRELRRGDVYETRKGACRLGPNLLHEVAGVSDYLRDELALHAEDLARTLVRAPDRATPLTRRRHRSSVPQRQTPTGEAQSLGKIRPAPRLPSHSQGRGN